jgi:hypothetical protein
VRGATWQEPDGEQPEVCDRLPGWSIRDCSRCACGIHLYSASRPGLCSGEH